MCAGSDHSPHIRTIMESTPVTPFVEYVAVTCEWDQVQDILNAFVDDGYELSFMCQSVNGCDTYDIVVERRR